MTGAVVRISTCSWLLVAACGDSADSGSAEDAVSAQNGNSPEGKPGTEASGGGQSGGGGTKPSDGTNAPGASAGSCDSLLGDNTESTDLAGPCETAVAVGRFEVACDGDFAFVTGNVRDGVVPSVVRTEESTMGSCTLLRRPLLLCEPKCDVGETCDAAGKCIPFPASRDVGKVCIGGLEPPILELTSSAPTFNYSYTKLTPPPFSEGDPVQLKASLGGEDIALRGFGFAPLSEATKEVVIAAGEDVELSWKAAKGETPSRVFVELTVDQHGSSPLAVRCAFEDSGSGVIAGALIDQLLSSGVSGFPNGTIQRATYDSVALKSGCVDFALTDTDPIEIRVEGHVPCKGDQDCDEGIVCDVENETCQN